MSCTKSYRVYGEPGHRQKMSFENSFVCDFSDQDNIRRIAVLNYDVTGIDAYSIVIITRNTEIECDSEINAQVDDGLFENCRTGKIEKINML